MVWSAEQVKDFARRFRKSYCGPQWQWMVPQVREALVAQFVLGIVEGNFQDVTQEAIRQLHVDLEAWILTKD